MSSMEFRVTDYLRTRYNVMPLKYLHQALCLPSLLLCNIVRKRKTCNMIFPTMVIEIYHPPGREEDTRYQTT